MALAPPLLLSLIEHLLPSTGPRKSARKWFLHLQIMISFYIVTGIATVLDISGTSALFRHFGLSWTCKGGKMNKWIILPMLLFAFGGGQSFCQNESAPANGAGIQYLGHVAVAVSDLGTAMHFYCDQLGFTEVFRLNGPNGSPMLVYLRSELTTTILLSFFLERKSHPGPQRNRRASAIWAFL